MTTNASDTPFLLFIGQRTSDRSAAELSAQGRLRVHWEDDLGAALERLPEGTFDAIVLDSGLSAKSISEVRLKSSSLLLTLADTPEACFEAMEAGADDFILKPCHAGELLVRTRSLLARRRGSGPSWLQFGPLTINVRAHEACLNGHLLDLTHSELTILKCLVTEPFKTVTRDELALALYQRESSPYERSIDVHVSNLRRKIETSGGIRIRSVRGVGYLLSTDMLRVVDAARAS
ncbi:MAG TPA: response regulator transcription factor [Bryobacteraceae bacterium]|jgi:DNA-binding response OmpR family regulator|nr:response regulator transcription factor [Bryobacteraceae bacterium]